MTDIDYIVEFDKILSIFYYKYSLFNLYKKHNEIFIIDKNTHTISAKLRKYQHPCKNEIPTKNNQKKTNYTYDEFFEKHNRPIYSAGWRSFDSFNIKYVKDKNEDEKNEK